MALALEPVAVKHSDFIVSVSEGTNELIRSRYPFLKASHFQGIPYGSERGDFEYLKSNPIENPFFVKNERTFNFVYVGAMLPKGYDTIRALFLAIQKILEEKPSTRQKIRLYFIGTTYASN